MTVDEAKGEDATAFHFMAPPPQHDPDCDTPVIPGGEADGQ